MISDVELDNIIENEIECDFSLADLALELTDGILLSRMIDEQYYDDDLRIPGDKKDSPYFLHISFDPDDDTPYIALWAGDDSRSTEIYEDALPCVVDFLPGNPECVLIKTPEEDNWGEFACERELARKCLCCAIHA